MPTWTIGTGKDYTTLADALAAAVIAGDDYYTFECYGGSNLGKIDFTGTALNSSYFTIQPAVGEGHNGDITTGAYIETTNGDDAITVTDDTGVAVYGMRIKCSNTGGIPGRCIYVKRAEAVNWWFTVEVGQSILIQTPPAGYDAAEAIRVDSDAYDDYGSFWSNLLVNQGDGAYGSATAAVRFNYVGVSGSFYPYEYLSRHTIVCNGNWKYGIQMHRDTGTASSIDAALYAYNNLVLDASTADYVTTADTGTGSLYVDGQGNGDSDGTADAWGGSYGNGVTGVTTATFNNFAGDDFSLAVNSTCRDSTSRSWYSDILSTAEQGSGEDIGCFEFVVLFPDHWAKRFKVTIPSGAINGDLLDYPVVFDLSRAPAGFHTVMAAQGTGSIRMTKADGETRVPVDVAWYDAASDTGELHFNTDGILLVGSDNHFWVYYDQEYVSLPVGDSYSASDVWNKTTQFHAAFHLTEAANTTSYGYLNTIGYYPGTGVGRSVDSTGVFGGSCPDFDGSGDYINQTYTPALPSYSIMAVVKPDNSGSRKETISVRTSSNPDSTYSQSLRLNNGKTEGYLYSGGAKTVTDTGAALSTSDFTVLHSTAVQSGLIKAYTAGLSVGTPVTIGTPEAGVFNCFARQSASAAYLNFDGKIDELRIATSVLSDDWCQADSDFWTDQASVITVGAEEVVPQFPVDWGKRVKITIPSGTISGDILDYIFVFDLSRMPAGFHTVMAAQGTGSIRVTNAAGDELAYDLAFYDATNDEGEIHINTGGTLLSGSDNDFYIYYDNVDTPYPRDPQHTWNVGAVSFAGVWHLTEAFNNTTGGYKNTAIEGLYLGTGTSMSSDGTGVFGGTAPDFDGAADYITTGFVAQYSNFTAFAIFSGTGSNNARVMDKSYIGGFWMGRRSTGGAWGGGVREGGSPFGGYVAITPETNYEALVVQRTGTTRNVYGHGTALSDSATVSGTNLDSTAIRLGVQNPSGEYLNGTIDEVRITSIILSTDWIQADYDFWLDQVNSIDVGVEENLGAVSYTATADANLSVIVSSISATFVAPIYSGSGVPEVAPIESSSSSTFTGTTYTGSLDPTLGAIECTSTSEFDTPVFTGNANQSMGAVENTSTGEFDTPVYTGSAAFNLSAIECTSAGEFDNPIYTGSAGLNLGNIEQVSTGTFSSPVFTSGAANTLSAIECTSTGEFDAPIYTGLASLELGNVESVPTAEFDAPLYSGSCSLNLGNVESAAGSDFDAPTYTSTSTLISPQLTAVGTAEFDVPVYAGSSDLSLSNVSSVGNALFAALVYAASVDGSLGQTLSTSEGTFEVPTFTASLNLTSASIETSVIAVFASGVFSGSVSVEAGQSLITSESTFIPPVFSAAVEALNAATLSGINSTFLMPTFTASGVTEAGSITLVSSAEFDVPVYTATLDVATAGILNSASGSFEFDFTAIVTGTLDEILVSCSATFVPDGDHYGAVVTYSGIIIIRGMIHDAAIVRGVTNVTGVIRGVSL